MEESWRIQTCGMMNSFSVYDKKTGIDWKWQVIDGIVANAPLEGGMCKCRTFPIVADELS